MKFTKMHGAGNDYVYVDCTKERIGDPESVARFVSDRHKGIGSDGLIMILPSEKADFEMGMYNADGSRGAMCGNGIRCVGKYVYDHGLTDRTEITVDTPSGVKHLFLNTADGKVQTVRVDMGEPILEAEKIPVLAKDPVVNRVFSFNDILYQVTCVSMGNPHAVIYVDSDVKELEIEKIGPNVEFDRHFPDRVNTEFVNVISRDEVSMRVWERGSGETMACGTGACAVGVAGVLTGRTNRTVTVHLLGGDLLIEWDEASNHVFMTGEAVEVFEGEINV